MESAAKITAEVNGCFKWACSLQCRALAFDRNDWFETVQRATTFSLELQGGPGAADSTEISQEIEHVCLGFFRLLWHELVPLFFRTCMMSAHRLILRRGSRSVAYNDVSGQRE